MVSLSEVGAAVFCGDKKSYICRDPMSQDFCFDCFTSAFRNTVK